MSSGMSRAHAPMLARSFSWTRWFHELMPIPPWPQQFPELNHFIRPGHELMAWLRMHWSSSCFFTSFYLVEKLEWFMSWLNFDVEHALNGWAHEFLIKSSKIRGGFCRVCGGFCRVRGGFGRASISGQSITMLNISFRSRVFSSDSLMDGEAILANQVFDDMDVAALEAELNRLKDRFWASSPSSSLLSLLSSSSLFHLMGFEFIGCSCFLCSVTRASQPTLVVLPFLTRFGPWNA